MGGEMSARQILQKLYDKKQAEIAELESQLAQAKAYLQAIQDSIKAMPRESAEAEQALRAGTNLAHTREILKAYGKPMHISEILKAMGKPIDKKNRLSLSGSLATYARRKEIFVRTAPNTFGLIEFGVAPKEMSEDLPENFGSRQ